MAINAPADHQSKYDAMLSDEKSYVSLLSDEQLGLYSVWIRRHALTVDELGLPEWVAQWVEFQARCAQEELDWRHRMARRGGPEVARGNYRERVEAIRQNTSIVQSILLSGVFIEKRGKEWLGNCPFHDDKSPSFSVNDEIRVWHCFGCGEGGDIFRFLELRLNLPFPEVVALLERGGSIAETAYGRAV